jgi:hypothetical protein
MSRHKDPPMTRERWESKFGDWYVPEPNTGCWLWNRKALKGKRGEYGSALGMNAHRAAFLLMRGAIPPGLVVDHLCRQTFCVNPDHLRLTSNRENVLSGSGHTAMNSRKTHCIRGHELTADNTRPSGTGRRCRKCENLWQRQRRSSLGL